MGFGTHLVNGIVSLAISVGVTVALADDDDGPWDLTEMALAVGVSAFLSGFFTSLFAKPDGDVGGNTDADTDAA
jgi:hypothetical protein